MAKKKAPSKKTAKKAAKATAKKPSSKKKPAKKKPAKKKPAKKKPSKKKPAKKPAKKKKAAHAMADQTTLQNDAMFKHEFLKDIRNDKYYPPGTWERGVDILVRLCAAFERDQPKDPAGVFVLTHAATEEFNAMGDDEIDLETVARECIAADIMAILAAYGHGTLDIEEAIAPRDW